MFTAPSHSLHEHDPVLSLAKLHPHLLEDDDKFPCILVIPGGGYEGISTQESAPVAGWLNSIGISAAVLEYSVSSKEGVDIYPRPQQQALYAMRYLRANAAKLNINPQKIGVIGFSAGGHLSSCVANGFDRQEWLLDPDNCLSRVSARPDACILSYAVLSSGTDYSHHSSMEKLLGSRFGSQIMEHLCWENHINPSCPDTFLWHTTQDTLVPVENCYQMGLALQKAQVPHELHIFPKGPHGLGLGTIGRRRQGSADQWRSLAERWLRELGF